MRIVTLFCFVSLSACAVTGTISDGNQSGIRSDEGDSAIGDAGSGTDTSTPGSDVKPGDDAPAPGTDTGTTTTPPGSDSGTTPPPTDSGGTTPPPTDSGVPPPTDSGGPAPVCTSPYSPPTLGACGIERWSIKVGEDTAACSISLGATPTTIASLRSLSPGGGGTSRGSPTEDTVFIVRDVKLDQFKSETDNDYHLVISDSSGTMIAEIPDPGCMPSSGPWQTFVKAARAAFDARHPASSSWSYPSETVSIKGVGFFDANHGQTGVAPNAIELHPVLAICFGAGCTP